MALLDWCSANGIRIHPNLRILHRDHDKKGIYVRAADAPILPEQSLVVIPKSAVLSTRSCALAQHIPHAPYGHDATLTLALALYSEQLLASRSRWVGYLESLPSDQNWHGIALFWDAALCDPLSSHDTSGDGRRAEPGGLDPDGGDAAEARRWLLGTEAETHFLLPGPTRTPVLDEISGFYLSVAVPLLERAGLSPSEGGFRHAYALVSSRAFMVDAYHGLAMVPIADAFNHSQENSIHLESDYDVCTSCGSLSECPHDMDARDETSAASCADTAEPENTCEMVINAVVMPGEEVFNTYGAKLTNAELLVRYGFILDANDNDILTWTTDEVWDAAGSALIDLPPRPWDDDDGYAVYMEILRDWQFDAGWGDSALVIDTEPDGNRNSQYMTADGVLSHKLWLAIALAASRRQGTTVEATQTRELMTRIAWTQIQMEQGHARARNEGGDKGDDDGEDDDAYEALGRLVRSIGELCARRLDRISRLNVQQQGDHGLGLHSAVVGKYIDDLDTTRQKTQLAVTLALGEVSIVESCVAGWDELAASWAVWAE